jgi:hypothetical protein
MFTRQLPVSESLADSWHLVERQTQALEVSMGGMRETLWAQARMEKAHFFDPFTSLLLLP